MATYNGEKYISQQIDSILNQEFTDFNLIICDDQSTDQTIQIIKEYMQKDSRISLYINESNLGYNQNFMKLIQLSNAPFFSIADQDDIWYPNQLNDLYEAIIVNNVDIVYGESKYIDSFNQPILIRDYVKHIKVTKPYVLFEDNIVPGRNMLVNARLKKYLFPVPPLSRFFIYDWYLALKAVENQGIYYINRVINQYRVHQSSVTNTDVYSPLRKKSLKEKFIYIETLREQALNHRLQRVEIFKAFLNEVDQVNNYELYIKSLNQTKFINLHLNQFFKYMKIRTTYYKFIFLISFHFPFLYRIFIMKHLKVNRRTYES